MNEGGKSLKRRCKVCKHESARAQQREKTKTKEVGKTETAWVESVGCERFCEPIGSRRVLAVWNDRCDWSARNGAGSTASLATCVKRRTWAGKQHRDTRTSVSWRAFHPRFERGAIAACFDYDILLFRARGFFLINNRPRLSTSCRLSTCAVCSLCVHNFVCCERAKNISVCVLWWWNLRHIEDYLLRNISPSLDFKEQNKTVKVSFDFGFVIERMRTKIQTFFCNLMVFVLYLVLVVFVAFFLFWKLTFKTKCLYFIVRHVPTGISTFLWFLWSWKMWRKVCRFRMTGKLLRSFCFGFPNVYVTNHVGTGFSFTENFLLHV